VPGNASGLMTALSASTADPSLLSDDKKHLVLKFIARNDPASLDEVRVFSFHFFFFFSFFRFRCFLLLFIFTLNHVLIFSEPARQVACVSSLEKHSIALRGVGTNQISGAAEC
jgi:hypothetical protein